jgi:rubrerythrin
MTFNPLAEKGIPLDRQLRSWSELNVQPYDKESVHPYTRCRIIVMNGIEVESIIFSHQFARNTIDTKLKGQLAQVRRMEQQQQKSVNWLVPGDETTLENTIGYEQVAVDLTAGIAQLEPDPYLRQVYEFGVLEDFDHLYRYANLLDMIEGKKAERLTGDYTEIMPGRPTIFEHRHPLDDLRRPMTVVGSSPQSKLNALTVMAAEQQTMSFYMNMGNRYIEPIARGLYLEIAQIEEQHVSHYESILDPEAGWMTNWVLHEYNECWLYWSFLQDEADPRVRAVWELHLGMEIEHLRIACEAMRQIEGRDPAEFLPTRLDTPLTFHENKQWLRTILDHQVGLTGWDSEFIPVAELPADHRYHAYQSKVNAGGAPTEEVIRMRREQAGEDYRFAPEGPHPVAELQCDGSGQTPGYADQTREHALAYAD